LLGLAITVMTQPIGYQAVPRDAFPVFDNPDMLTAEAAERAGVIYPRDVIIGVRHGQAAKAYPITVMGVHELGNDTLDGIPIAVSW
jgi:hypothetical protein